MAKQDLSRFFTSTKGAIATVGTLVAIVVGVYSLLPKHEPTPPLKASFSRVTAYPNVALKEYEERYGSRAVAEISGSGSHSPPVLTVPYRLVDVTGPPESTSTETGETTVETTTETTSDSTEGPTTTEETEPSGTGDVPPMPAPFKETNGVLARDGNGTDPAEEHAVAEALSNTPLPMQGVLAATPPQGGSTELAVPDSCSTSSCAITSIIDDEVTYNSDPIKAARAVAAAFADSRGRVIGHKLYPSGAAVNYTIELVGFKDREAILKWSLWSKSEGKPLPRRWLRNVITKEIKPKGEDESFSSQFWIPTPHSRGDYVVHLTVLDREHVERGEAETEPPFH